MPITALLERNARIRPDAIALVEVNPAQKPDENLSWREYTLIQSTSSRRYRKEITWREFDVKANRFANLLLTRGIGRGDKVALLLMNCLDWLPLYFGILKAGAVAVPMNFRFSAEEISYCADLADVKVLVFGPEFVERVTAVKPSMAGVKTFFFCGEDGTADGMPPYAEDCLRLKRYCSSTVPPVEIRDEDDAAIYFSSGTTGFPKAILHRHDALMSAAEVEQKHHGQTEDDVFLCIPPLYHTGAKMHWFGSLLSGSRAVILRGVRPEWILETVSEERATIVWLLVPWAQDILDSIESGRIDPKNYRLNQWRLMHIGAQPVPPSLIRRWLAVFPHHQYDTNYGLSESIGPGAVHLGVENIAKVGAIGVPGYGWKVKILADDGSEAGTDEVGELCLSGRGVMKCYYKNPEATAEVLSPDGWLRTGDMARRDEDGFIYLVDRKKDVIIVGGENIYPVQIEDFLRTCDKVADVGVIGLPDDRLGEITCAVIQVKEGAVLTEQEVNDFCMTLPRYKRPRRIIFDRVPRNATGKIQKNALREKYGAVRVVEVETTK